MLRNVATPATSINQALMYSPPGTHKCRTQRDEMSFWPIVMWFDHNPVMAGEGDRDKPQLANRAERLFRYLRDLSQLRTKSVRDVDDYEQVVWLKDLPDGTNSWSLFRDPELGEESGRWLEVERVTLPPPPSPPPDVEVWIRVSNIPRADLDEPGLVDPEELEALMPDAVNTEYQRYLSDDWRPWAREYLNLRPAYDFYTGLFAMSERRQTLGEVFELVLGIGLLVWIQDGRRIRRHMITTPVQIAVDGDTGTISVEPSDTEGRNRLELDMIESTDRGQPKAVRGRGDQRVAPLQGQRIVVRRSSRLKKPLDAERNTEPHHQKAKDH